MDDLLFGVEFVDRQLLGGNLDGDQRSWFEERAVGRAELAGKAVAGASALDGERAAPSTAARARDLGDREQRLVPSRTPTSTEGRRLSGGMVPKPTRPEERSATLSSAERPLPHEPRRYVAPPGSGTPATTPSAAAAPSLTTLRA